MKPSTRSYVLILGGAAGRVYSVMSGFFGAGCLSFELLISLQSVFVKCICIDYQSCYGEVSERLKEPVSKTGVPFTGTAGSNPALSGFIWEVVLVLGTFSRMKRIIYERIGKYRAERSG